METAGAHGQGAVAQQLPGRHALCWAGGCPSCVRLPAARLPTPHLPRLVAAAALDEPAHSALVAKGGERHGVAVQPRQALHGLP